MIDPKELRIGNFVIDTVGMRQVELFGITGNSALYLFNDSMAIIGMNFEKTMINANPIPITPEWLERLGFESGRIGKYRVKQFETVTQGKFDFYRLTIVGTLPHQLDVKLKYIHQLQNLIYFLTGEELQIKGKTN